MTQRPADVFQQGLLLLAGRDRSRQALEHVLLGRGHPPREVGSALDRLVALGYLDDARFARARARSLLAARWGEAAIVERLVAAGFGPVISEEAAHEAPQELGEAWVDVARALLRARGLSGDGLGPRERARAARLLVRRGFSPQVVEELLGDATVDSERRDD